MTDKFSRALDSYEARFSRGPADPSLHTCTGCRFEVDSVDDRGECDDCASDPARIAARELTEEEAEMARCEAELAADEGFTAWLSDRRTAANELQAREVDARANALRVRAVAAEVSAWEAHDAGREGAVALHSKRAERLWEARDAAVVVARTVRSREVA